MRFNTIVVGIDFSERSLATARWVAHHLSPGAELVFVHVVPEPGRRRRPGSVVTRLDLG